MRHDMLSDVLSAIRNGDDVGAKTVLTGASGLITDVLKVMQKNGFVGSFEYIDNGRGGKYKVYLLGNVNGCGAIRPRFAVNAGGYEKYEKRFLPAAGFGMLIVSTSKGVMSQEEAREQGIGGKLLAFVY